MAVTKSTTNSKLPKVKKMGFIKKAKNKKGKVVTSTFNKLYCGVNGQFSASVGFKQTSKKYPYQIQYRTQGRWLSSLAQEKGADYDEWSDWKCTTAISGVVPANGSQTLYPRNYWLKSNVGVNKKGNYKTFYTFTNYLINTSLYDSMKFQFRVRSFNKSKSKHGQDTSGTVQVFTKAAVTDYAAVTSVDGGFKLKFNYLFSRDITVTITSVIHNEELLKKNITKRNITIEDLSSTSTPAYRNNYQGAYVNVNISDLKMALKTGDAVRVIGYIETIDGAKTSFAQNLVIVNPDDTSQASENLGITIDSVTWDDTTKLLYVVTTKTGTTTALEIAAVCTYTYNGNTYSIEPLYDGTDLSSGGTFVFSPPFNSTLSIQAAVRANNLVYRTTATGTSGTGLGYWFNKEEDLDLCGVAWGNSNLTVKTVPAYDSSLPVGRDSNVIFYADNSSTTISFTATIIDKDNVYGGDYQRFSMWDNIRRNQGVYYLRTSRGELYKVGIIGVNIVKKQPQMYELTVDMAEVV